MASRHIGAVNVPSEETQGLIYQKPLVYSKYLPYSKRLEDEAKKLLDEIKENLSVAVQKRELWPGALYWTNRLSSFLRAYGYQFSKADHLKLVKLLYGLVTIPNLESPLLHSWGNLLGKLLKKWRLLSREDLCLPWQPLYELVKRVFYSNYQKLGMMIYSVHATNAVHLVVSQARVYFPLESTQEMLDEWSPLMCPFDLSMVESINLLSEFLPTLLPPQEHNCGFRLWFKEFITVWLATHSVTSAEEFCVKLFVRLAKDNIGYIDWTPYMPQLFTRILRSFQLPVGPKELRTVSQNNNYFGAGKAATLIVSMLGGGSPTQKHLSQLMIALESYYHPSNFGKHTKALLLFLKELALRFILRLKKERFSKPSWFYCTPDHAKLTKTDVDNFVQCLLPAMRMAVFSKVGTQDAAVAMHNLVLVRPEMVLPDLLNRTYTALETLTEPHQVTATLQCVIAVSRALLSGGAGKYPEGRKHLFSLLFLALPGIDPNDFRKTLVSGLLISALVTGVPLVDCSPSIGQFEMTEEEIELCSLTSQFEDFVLQFLDRCFALIENIRLEQATALDRVISSISINAHESIVGMGMAGTVHSVLMQCSPKIFDVALDKLFHFATSHVFESEVAGRMCAEICASASKVDAVSTLKLFVPHCVDVIKAVLEDPDQRESEHPDNNLVWNVQLLSRILHAQGSALMPHADTVISCLKSCVHLKCKSAAQHAAKALYNILRCLTLIYPAESRSTASGFSKPPEEHLYIKDWAIAGDMDHLALEWHVPSEKECDVVDRILLELLQPELDKLEGFMRGDIVDRESLHLCLQLVWYILLGAAAYLPMWKGKQVDGCPSSVVNMERDFYIFKSDSTQVPPDQFSRENLANFVHKLAGHVLQYCEDDTKSIIKLAQILKTLLVNFGVDKAEFDTKWQLFNQSKIALEDKLHGKKQHIRPMIISRIHLLHEFRVLARSMSTLTPLHLTLLKDLFRMSISTYTEIRIRAQQALSSCLDSYLYSGRKLLPDIWPLLSSDNGVSHEQFKGALHLLMLSPVMNVFLHDWELMSHTLPAIVKADHSEKPTILNIMNKMLREVATKYDYFSIQFQVPETCASAAATLHTQLSSEEIGKGKARTEEMNQASIQAYTGLVNILVEVVEQEKLQWRYSQMATQLLVMLIRHDHPFPLSGVKLLVKGLTHDYITIRKVAIKAISPILLQQKRKLLKVPVDICKEAGVGHLDVCVPPGERDDNKWLCYDPELIPRTAEQWDSFPFIDKTHWGYHSWPKTLLTYAPYKEQPQLDRELKELSETEQVFYDAFSSPEFVEKLVAFLSMEENKGRDKYDINRHNMFKGLFRNFGRMFLPLLKPHLEKLAVDSQESSQRCAAEIIAGLISGSKHWKFEMVEELWNFLEPLIKKVLEAVTPETVEDWGACFTDSSANRDPRRIHWLLEVLVIDPLHGTNGSFMDAGRLYLLQCALAQQEWRVATILHRLLDYLRSYLSHPFKPVREQIGSTLAQIYLTDSSSTQVKFNPLRKDLLSGLYPMMPDMDQLATLDRNGDAFKLCKTVLGWLNASYHQSEPELFRLLARLLPLVTVEDDEEIGQLVKAACARMCHAELSPTTVPPVLACLNETIESTLWRVRVPALQLLQVIVFRNLFTFTSVSTEVTDILLRLTEDSQIEVRELAASTVSGLVRCGYISCIDKLKDLFTAHSRTRLPKRAKTAGTSGAATKATGYEVLLVKRHSGVLGLAALVEACPYSVPKWLPEVLDEMALHLHDPAPIQATVKKTMSEFRRTHYDSWSEHKQKFTDDQLAVLADLLISPSYYA